MTWLEINTAPRVFVAGVSTPARNGFAEYLTYVQQDWPTQDSVFHPEALLEVAGRVCYGSWSGATRKSREEYLASSIIEHKHGSVLEHLSVNFLIADLPRSSQLELVRHGDGTAFSFESTRFTDKRLRFVVPPRIRNDEDALRLWREQISRTVETYRNVVALTVSDEDDGTLKTKRAKEAARAILPNCQGSDGMVTINARALRWIIESRTDEHADQSIREFAYNLYRAALPHIPSVFVDATEQSVAEGTPRIVFASSKV